MTQQYWFHGFQKVCSEKCLNFKKKNYNFYKNENQGDIITDTDTNQ